MARKKELEEKRAQKVAFLIEKSRKEKNKRRKGRVVELRGIDVSDKRLDQKFESELRNYGGVELSCAVKKPHLSDYNRNSQFMKYRV